jgi:ankyrin repeat protein
MIATMQKNKDIIALLIGYAKAKLNTRENSGATIFIAACAGGSLEITKYLFSLNGVNKLAKNNDG